MNKHRTRPVTNSDRVWVVARERGNRVRYQDRTTGRMTGWCASPAYLARKAEAERRMLHLLTQQGQPERDQFIAGYIEDMLSLKRDKLVDIAAHRDVKHPSKANKVQIATLLAEASYAAQVTM